MWTRLACAAVLLAGCATEEGALCGEGLEPVIVTGLSGTIDGAPAVEVIYRVPDTCEVVDRAWMFWDDEAESLSFGPEPTGTLSREGVDTEDEDRRIFFRDAGVGVRLDYPDDEPAGSVTFTWFAAGIDLASGACDGDGVALSCGE